jgi:hypothetical protein
VLLRGERCGGPPVSIAHPRRRRTADHLPDWKAPTSRDIQMKIGEGLKAHYELPMELPVRLLTLVMQIDERQEQEK